MVNENWLPINGYEDYYEVSDQGRIRSLRTGRLMKTRTVNKYGYQAIGLSVGGKSKQRAVHRLVLTAFVGPCPEGMEACHGDHDPRNNRLENLRWDTRAANMMDRRAKPKLCPKGHPVDAVKYHADGTFWQRRCRTCLREQGRARRAAKMTCPQGHRFDGVRYRADGSVRQRYCKLCAHAALDRGRETRWAKR